MIDFDISYDEPEFVPRKMSDAEWTEALSYSPLIEYSADTAHDLQIYCGTFVDGVEYDRVTFASEIDGYIICDNYEAEDVRVDGVVRIHGLLLFQRHIILEYLK